MTEKRDIHIDLTEQEFMLLRYAISLAVWKTREMMDNVQSESGKTALARDIQDLHKLKEEQL